MDLKILYLPVLAEEMLWTYACQFTLVTDTVAEVSTTMSVTKLNINPQLSLQIKRDTNRGLEMFRLAAVLGTYMNVCYPG